MNKIVEQEMLKWMKTHVDAINIAWFTEFMGHEPSSYEEYRGMINRKRYKIKLATTYFEVFLCWLFNDDITSDKYRTYSLR